LRLGGSVRWRLVSTTSVRVEHLLRYCRSADRCCSLHYRRSISSSHPTSQ